MPLHLETLSEVSYIIDHRFPPGFNNKKLPGGIVLSFLGAEGSLTLQEYCLPQFELLSLTAAFKKEEKILLQTDVPTVLIIFNQHNKSFHIQYTHQIITLHKNQFLSFQLIHRAREITLSLIDNTLFIINIPKQFLLEITQQLPSTIHPLAYNTPQQTQVELSEILQSILSCRFIPPFRDYYYETKIKDLLLHTQAINAMKNQEAAVIPLAILEAINKAEALITEDITKHIPIPELAKKVLLNEFQLKASFKKVYGMGPYEYLVKLRMLKAKEWLLEGKSVKEVAALTGYRPSDFTMAFINYYNITPGSLKRRNQ